MCVLGSHILSMIPNQTKYCKTFQCNAKIMSNKGTQTYLQISYIYFFKFQLELKHIYV